MKRCCDSESSTIVIVCTPLCRVGLPLLGVQEGKCPRETQETEMDGYLSDNNIVLRASCRSLLLILQLIAVLNTPPPSPGT